MKNKKNKKCKKIPIIRPPMKSRRYARKVTTQFHRLTHELEKTKNTSNLSLLEKNKKINDLQNKIKEIGGREAYQDASILSTSFHKTSKWIFQILTKYNLRPNKNEKPIKLLEVGAINTQLLSCPWLNVLPIDLISRDPKIKQIDFFTIQPNKEYKVIVSSMVLNCLPNMKDREKMLNMYYDHLQDEGYLFLMLPTLCLTSKKYLILNDFYGLISKIGFIIKENKNSPKITFFFLQKEI